MDNSFVTRYAATIVLTNPTSLPHRYIWDSPPLPHHSPYDESYLGLGRLRTAARLAGVLPLPEPPTSDLTNVNKKVTHSKIASLDFSWISRWTLYTLLPLAAVVIATAFTVLDLKKRIREPLDRTIAGSSVVVLGVAAAINMLTGAARAAQWPLFYRRCQAVDVLLDLTWDEELDRFSRRLMVMLVALMIPYVLVAILTVATFLLWGSGSAGLAGAAVVNALFVVPAIAVPELLFAYVSQATASRLARAGERLETALSDAASVHVLEKLRISFQLLNEAVRHTSIVLGPALGVSCLLHTGTIGLVTYLFLRRPAPPAMLAAQAIVALIAVVRIVPICFLADRPADEAGNIAATLHTVSTRPLTAESWHEVYFFMECAKNSKPCYSVMEFWGVDKGFLNTIATVILTYIVTILQFDT